MTYFCINSKRIEFHFLHHFSNYFFRNGNCLILWFRIYFIKILSMWLNEYLILLINNEIIKTKLMFNKDYFHFSAATGKYYFDLNINALKLKLVYQGILRKIFYKRYFVYWFPIITMSRLEFDSSSKQTSWIAVAGLF